MPAMKLPAGGLQWKPQYTTLGAQINAAEMGGNNPMAMFPAGKALGGTARAI